MGVHDGHRERLRTRFAEHGLDNFNDVNVLELLLFYSRQRCDTNVIAHALLERFGSLDAVFEAPLQELAKVSGVGKETARFLHLIPQVSRRYMISKGQFTQSLASTKAAGDYIAPLFMYEKDELVYMVCLDSACKVLDCRILGRGVANSTEISIRKIVETAINHNASNIIIAHNHPNGMAIPSREDEITTRQINSALSLVGVRLLDHIIVAGDDYISLADSGMIAR